MHRDAYGHDSARPAALLGGLSRTPESTGSALSLGLGSLAWSLADDRPWISATISP